MCFNISTDAKLYNEALADKYEQIGHDKKDIEADWRQIPDNAKIAIIYGIIYLSTYFNKSKTLNVYLT